MQVQTRTAKRSPLKKVKLLTVMSKNIHHQKLLIHLTAPQLSIFRGGQVLQIQCDKIRSDIWFVNKSEDKIGCVFEKARRWQKERRIKVWICSEETRSSDGPSSSAGSCHTPHTAWRASLLPYLLIKITKPPSPSAQIKTVTCVSGRATVTSVCSSHRWSFRKKKNRQSAQVLKPLQRCGTDWELLRKTSLRRSIKNINNVSKTFLWLNMIYSL